MTLIICCFVIGLSVYFYVLSCCFLVLRLVCVPGRDRAIYQHIIVIPPFCRGWTLNMIQLMYKHPSLRGIHLPHISTGIYWRIPGDHPHGNFPVVSPRKCRRNRGEFSMRIFPLLSCQNPRGYIRIEISLAFPSRGYNAILRHRKGCSCVNISQ